VIAAVVLAVAFLVGTCRFPSSFGANRRHATSAALSVAFLAGERVVAIAVTGAHFSVRAIVE
jgi:hypothetical protein